FKKCYEKSKQLIPGKPGALVFGHGMLGFSLGMDLAWTWVCPINKTGKGCVKRSKSAGRI
ncbi:MAG: hypothetical protein ACKO17_05740, partial [Bacteroidota bacterium]